jgi:formylglycine-generating enzyme required for sulfatase activity
MKPEAPPRDGTRRYAVFLSYRHDDNQEPGRQWATWLHQMLENYEIPSGLVGTQNSRGELIPASMYPVFRDEEELPADAELSAPINHALRNSRHLIVICSPAAVESRFVNDEIRTFKKLGKADRVLAVIIRGEPNTADDPAKYAAGFTAADECFPEVLRRKLDEKGEITDQVTQPIAADFRPSGTQEGWTSPQGYRDYLEQVERAPKNEVKVRLAKYTRQCALMKLKIIAGVLGVPLGELTRRDQAYQLERARKRQRVIIWVAVALAVLLCLTVAAGVIALVKQGEAQRALKEQKRLSFEAVVRNAEADDAQGESVKVIAALEPYLSERELAQHPMRAKAEQLAENARDDYKRLATFAEAIRKGEQTVALDLGSGVILDMVLIPAGTFTMGSPENERNRSVTMASPEDEKNGLEVEKSHQVAITQPFYMGKFHVTQEQYQAVARTNPSYFNDRPKNPVEQVSWSDAVAFCEKLEKQSGAARVRLSLPTEAQWEYACRAGTQTRFYFGDDENKLEQYAWYTKNAGPGTAGYGTHPVGEKNMPNRYGLHDMHGNVFDWCKDWYGSEYYSRSPKNDPAGLETGEIVKSINSTARVMRGGSWRHTAEYCRSAHRDYDAPGDRYSDLGFRVVVAPSSQEP